MLGDRVGGRRPALRGLPRQLGGHLRGGEVSSYGFESAREAFDYEQEGDDGGGYDDPAGWRDKYCAAIMAHEGGRVAVAGGPADRGVLRGAGNSVQRLESERRSCRAACCDASAA